MKFPFLYYGVYPGDWYEGANCGHMWEAQFAAPLDAEARQRVARAFGAFVGNSRKIDFSCMPVRFSESWMLVNLGEEWDDDDDDEFGSEPDEFWEEIEGLWSRIHAVAPLVEVHFSGTREEGVDDWSAWSVEQKPIPGPAPDWEEFDLNIDLFGAAIVRYEADIEEEDPAFEKTLHEIADEASDND